MSSDTAIKSKGPVPASRLTLDINAVNLNHVYKATSRLVDEVRIAIVDKGMRIAVVDPAHVCMAVLELSSSFFEKFRARNLTDLGVDLGKVKEILKRSKKTKKNPDIISMALDHGCLAYSVGVHKGKMSLIDTSGMSDPKVPNLNLTSSFRIRVKELAEFIKAAGAVSDCIKIEVVADGIVLKAWNDTDVVKIEAMSGSDHVPTVQGPPCYSLYSQEYFDNLVKAANGATDFVDIHLGMNYPLRMEYELDGGAGTVLFLLAPKLENESNAVPEPEVQEPEADPEPEDQEPEADPEPEDQEPEADPEPEDQEPEADPEPEGQGPGPSLLECVDCGESMTRGQSVPYEDGRVCTRCSVARH